MSGERRKYFRVKEFADLLVTDLILKTDAISMVNHISDNVYEIVLKNGQVFEIKVTKK